MEQDPSGKVAMMHGKMKDEEKLDVMSRMKSGEFSMLVASTVIEIGVTIPALKSIIIVNPECYGVSTLHQMRGRVARNGGEGECWLYLPESVGEDTIERLKLLEQYSDGFTLADKDMEMRGFGDLSSDSESQHGASRSSTFMNLKIKPSDISAVLNSESVLDPEIVLTAARVKVM